jgi:hypothetical protein
VQQHNLNRLQRGRNAVIMRLMQEQTTNTAAEETEMSLFQCSKMKLHHK